jgi:hypothetical protein
MTTNEQPPFGAAVSSLAIASSGITVPGSVTDPVSSVELPSANDESRRGKPWRLFAFVS